MLHGVRALAALSVVLQHTFQSFAFHQDRPNLSPVAWKALWLLNLGELPAIVFLILSGILLHLPNAQRGTSSNFDYRSFIKRRFLRIVPPYWVTSTIGIALSVTQYFDHKKVKAGEFLSHMMLAPVSVTAFVQK
jgi:peptidoglycan/LPS O-acetylase OafA/YrhL